MDYVALGKRIYLRRRELGLTQEFLAEKCFKSVSFIGHCERGTRIASVDTIIAIANVMDMSLDELFSDSLKRKDLTQTEHHEKLVDIFMGTLNEVEKLFKRHN